MNETYRGLDEQLEAKNRLKKDLVEKFKKLMLSADKTEVTRLIETMSSVDRDIKYLRKMSTSSRKAKDHLNVDIHNLRPPAVESTAAPLVIPASIRDATLSAAAQGQDLSGGAAILPGHALHNAHWPPLAKSVTDHGQSADPEQQSSPSVGPNKRS